MKLGIVLPQIGAHANKENVTTVAREAERLGFNSLWVTERLLYPHHPKQPYAGRVGIPLPEPYKNVLDPLDTLIFAAALTEKVRLGTSVLDFPFYAPARLGKRIATLDVFSNGRAVIAAGIGWSEEEYEASNVPFTHRGARLTEFIHALNALWGPDPVEFHGRFYHIQSSDFNPKPVQKPRPPLLLGGYSPQAIARAVQLADGFNPVARPNAADAEQSIRGFCKAWREFRGDAVSPEVVVRINHGRVADHAIDDERKFLNGSIEQIRDDLNALASWGATEAFFDFNFFHEEQSIGFMLDQMQKLRAVLEA